jgi:hypothetical protein
MNWANIKLIFANFIGLCVAFPPLPIALGCIILGLIIWGGLQSCRSANIEKKIDKIGTNITIEKTESNVLQNEKVNAQGDINNLERNSNQAVNQAENIRNANISNVNLSEAIRKLCRAFPESSECQK